MATPNYQGQSQPTASGGWFGSLFGVSAPVYAGAGQPTSKTPAYLGGSAPAYKPAPAAQTQATDTGSNGQFAIVIPRQMIEQ